MSKHLKGTAVLLIIFAILLYPVKNQCSQAEPLQAEEKAIPTRKLKPKVARWREIDVLATAYCNCKKCTGWGKGITASGVKTSRGVVAAPRHIPFGTVIRLEGLGNFTVQDRGGSIKARDGAICIDIWMPSHQEALNFGRRKLKGWIKVE